MRMTLTNGLILAAGAGALLAGGCGTSLSPLNPSPASAASVKPAGFINDWEDKDHLTISWLGAANTSVVAADGTTYSQYYDSGSPLPGGTPAYALHMWGQTANTAFGGSARFTFKFPEKFNIEAVAPLRRFVFSYKAGAASVSKENYFTFGHVLTDYSYYQVLLKPANQNWTQKVVYLPFAGTGPWNGGPWNGVTAPWSYGPCSPPFFAGPGNEFARPCWGAAAPRADWNTVKSTLTELYIDFPNNAAFELSLDDLRFE